MLFFSLSLKNKIWVNEFRCIMIHTIFVNTLLTCISAGLNINRYYDSPYRYGGFSLGARHSQLMSHADVMDEAIAELRQRFHLERVRDCCISAHKRHIRAL